MYENLIVIFGINTAEIVILEFQAKTFYVCPKPYALATRTKFQLQILNINVISGNVHFREIILESSWNVCSLQRSSVGRRM